MSVKTKAIVLLKQIHNHKILRANVLKHRIPSDEIKTIFLKIFEECKTPSKALFTFKSMLRNEKGNAYYIYAGDRGELPDPQWVYYIYYNTFKKHFGFSHGEYMMKSLRDAVQEYNNEYSESDTALMKELDDGNFAIAITTPLMIRISTNLNEYGEILFIDASGNVDRFGCKIFIIYTNSCAGGLPIGTIIVTSESMSVISEGLELWKKLFSPSSLPGRSYKGPRIFMSDDSPAERGALNNVFPESKLLLCIFHVLQATWRYLWDSHHGVPLCHRQTLYSFVKNMIYSKNSDDLKNRFENSIKNELVIKYPKFESYLHK